MHSALHFAGDCNDWFESGPVQNVLIKGNKFKNSAYAGGTAILINPHVLRGNRQYHKNITIVENEFEMREERFIDASFVENLVFKNNTYKRNGSLPSHPKPSDNGIRLTNCVGADVEEPRLYEEEVK